MLSRIAEARGRATAMRPDNHISAGTRCGFPSLFVNLMTHSIRWFLKDLDRRVGHLCRHLSVCLSVASQTRMQLAHADPK